MLDPNEELKKLTEIVLKESASDIHLSDGRYPSIRVTGTLIPLVKEPKLEARDTLKILSAMLDERKFQEFQSTKEIDFAYTGIKDARFRCNAFYHQEGVSIAMRLIPPTIKTLEELNLPLVLDRFTRYQQGFFLVVGPVGHGKSTTLASMISMINKERAEHIVTIEDPIEYVYQPERSIIDQREIGVDTKSFHAALAAMFRQDIDVVLIGEMRDRETIATAVTAAETGHLVFSTLHTNNAPQTIDRIIDTFPADQQEQIRTQLSQSLAGIFSQRLLPRVSGGLIPAYELLINTSAVSNLIREGRTHEINIVIETGMDDGMINMNRTLVDLVRKGEITPDIARMYSLNPEGLERAI